MKWLVVVPRRGPVLAISAICYAHWIKDFRDPAARITILADKSYPRAHYKRLIGGRSFVWKAKSLPSKREILTEILWHDLPRFDGLIAACEEAVPLDRAPPFLEVIGTLQNPLIRSCPPTPWDIISFRRDETIFEKPPFHWSFNNTAKEIYSSHQFKHWIFDDLELPDILLKWARKEKIHYSTESKRA